MRNRPDALERVADVRLVVGVELGPFVLAHHRVAERDRVGRRQHVVRRRLQVSVDPQERHVADLQMKVACTAFHGVPKEVVDVHPRLVVGSGSLGPERG
jgi:hypothetical protein